jgi:hypothetical protein
MPTANSFQPIGAIAQVEIVMHNISRITLLGLVLLGPANLAFCSDGDAVPSFVIEVEGGPVWQSRNKVQIPNTDEGSRFSLLDLQGKGPWPVGRFYLTWNINSRHGLRALAAPLSVTESSVLSSPVSFDGEVFDAGPRTEATYRFNSWRLSYAYRFRQSAKWAWWIGFTAKIRDAKIELAQEGVSAEKTDLGFVPLLHIRGMYMLTERSSLILDVDALAGGPGRAEDASLKFRYDVDDRWSLSAGYRTIEGGADVDEVYNFAWLHYAVVSASYSL